MKIAFDLNGVVRDIFLKTEQIYTKFYLEDVESEISSEYDESKDEWVEKNDSSSFEYSMSLPVKSMNLIDHFKFESQDELYNFFYVDFPMQIFGHSPSISANTFNILNDLYTKLRDDNEVYIISDEMGKSKPATLFFLSKYGSLIENIKFYSNTTILNTFDEFDVIITSNPNLLSLSNLNKKIIKVKTTYNEDLKSDYVINDLSELESVLVNLNLI